MKNILIGLTALCAWTMPLMASTPMEEDAQDKLPAQMAPEAPYDELTQAAINAIFTVDGAPAVLVISKEGRRVIPNPNLPSGVWLHPKERPPAPHQQ